MVIIVSYIWANALANILSINMVVILAINIVDILAIIVSYI